MIPDTVNVTAVHPVQVTLQPTQKDTIVELLRAENATLRMTLIEVTGQRDELTGERDSLLRRLITQKSWNNALRAELDKALQERPA